MKTCALLGCLLLIGCGDDDDAAVADSAPLDGSATPDAATTDASPMPDALVCNMVTNLGSNVMEMGVAEDAPTPMGGDLLDGTYVVTAAVIYTGMGGPAGPDGVMVRATHVQAGIDYEFINDGGSTPYITLGTSVTSGAADIDINETCPTARHVGFSKYDASPTAFTIYDYTNPFGVASLTFTKL